MASKRIISFLLSFLFSSFCLADQVQVIKKVLDNDLTVLVQEFPSSEIVSIYACVKTGSAVEGKYLGMGISHFLEHMLFKGTSHRAVGAIASEVKNLGGSINASTSHDYTIYTLDVPKASFAQGLDILSDMLMNSKIDADEMEKERKVIHGEMRLYNDRPDRVLSDAVFHNVYNQHPYRHLIIGYPDLFDSITHAQLYSYYKERYIPNNIVFSVAGAVKLNTVLPMIEEKFKNFKMAAYPQRNLPQEPPQAFKRYLEKEYPTPVIRFSFAYQGISILDPDLYALDVLSMALGQGESSRLYREVYLKKRWVEEISASNFTPQDRGVFDVQGTMVQDNLQNVLSTLKEMIADIQKKGLTSAELEKTKRQVLAGFVFSNQTAPSLAYRAAVEEAIISDSNFSRHYVDLVKNVSNEDIKRVARKYLKDSNLSVTVLKPKGSLIDSTIDEVSGGRKEIKKVVLDNGLTVLLHEDHNVLVGSVKLIVRGGTRAEQPSLSGIAQLTGATWAKATHQRSEEQIANAIDQRGGNLSSSSGHNSMQISMDVLSEDLNFALDLLEDLVKNPSFPKNAINHQRQNMLTAIDERQDDIMALTSRTLYETLYTNHSLHRDPLGTKESLAKITREDIIYFYNSLISSNNMIVSIFGNFDSEEVLQDLKKKFGSLKRGQFQNQLFEESPIDVVRVKELHMEKEQALLMVGFRAPRLEDKDRFGLEILDSILGAGLSGRLFIKIREELGQAYTTSSSYSPNLDTGTFVLYVLTKPEKVDSVKAILTQELEQLKTKEVSIFELQAAKNHLKGEMMRSLLTNEQMAFTASIDELYGLGYDFYQKFSEKVDSVTVQDVRRLAHTYLDISKAVIVITKPKGVDGKNDE